MDRHILAARALRNVALGASLLAFAACGGAHESAPSTSSSGSGGAGADGAGGSGGVPAGFACVGHVTLPTTNATTAPIMASVDDILFDTPVAGATVKICAEGDTACASPADTATTDSNGAFTATLPLGPTGFTGHGEVTAAGYFPHVIQATGPLIPAPGHVYSYPLAATMVGAVLAQGLGIQLDPTKGHIIAFVNDCDGQLAAGATIAIEGGGKTLVAYAIDGMPEPKATATDASGEAFAFNVEPGEVTLTGALVGTGTVFTKSTVIVRAGTMTEVFVLPTQ